MQTDRNHILGAGNNEISRFSSLKQHMLAWWMVGCLCSLILCPQWNVAGLFAFSLSGCIMGTILGIVTYPVRRLPGMIVGGAVFGCLTTLSLIAILGAAWDQQVIANGAVIGGLIPATALVWQVPLRKLSSFVERIYSFVFPLIARQLRSSRAS